MARTSDGKLEAPFGVWELAPAFSLNVYHPRQLAAALDYTAENSPGELVVAAHALNALLVPPTPGLPPAAACYRPRRRCYTGETQLNHRTSVWCGTATHTSKLASASGSKLHALQKLPEILHQHQVAAYLVHLCIKQRSAVRRNTQAHCGPGAYPAQVRSLSDCPGRISEPLRDSWTRPLCES